jgi:hypothetical protein
MRRVRLVGQERVKREFTHETGCVRELYRPVRLIQSAAARLLLEHIARPGS